ncbi:hypothetical protein [Asanoa sp. NPDC050611]|uniref:hypothetical protein n=1 Tax=Asanoa sp. NPDC050611 TaxID=3157098 RepID=UPI0033C8465D
MTFVLFAGYLTTALTHRLDHGGSWWQDGAAEVRTESERTQLVFTFYPGDRMTFGTTIRNPRPWPVTITGVADDGDHIFRVSSVTMNRPGDAGYVNFDSTTAVAFQPVNLGPGEEPPVFVTVTMPDVQFGEGSGLVFDDVAVSFNALGLPRHQQVPLGYRVWVRAPNGYVPRRVGD